MNKYIIYKATGGLTHMIGGLSNTIRLCKENRNNKLIIDCESHAAYKQKFSDWFNIKDNSLCYTEDYSIIPKHLKFGGIPVSALPKINPVYNNGCYYIADKNVSTKKLCSELEVVACSYTPPFNRNIKIINAIAQQLLEYATPLKEEYISVHFRNTDIKNDLTVFSNKIKACCDKNHIYTVYFATDDSTAFEQIKKLLPNYKIVQYSNPEYYSGQNIHYNHPNKYELVKNLLVDMIMILRSKIFINSCNSGVSTWLCDMINNKYNIFDINSNTILFKSPYDKQLRTTSNTNAHRYTTPKVQHRQMHMNMQPRMHRQPQQSRQRPTRRHVTRPQQQQRQRPTRRHVTRPQQQRQRPTRRHVTRPQQQRPTRRHVTRPQQQRPTRRHVTRPPRQLPRPQQQRQLPRPQQQRQLPRPQQHRHVTRPQQRQLARPQQHRPHQQQRLVPRPSRPAHHQLPKSLQLQIPKPPQYQRFSSVNT